MSTDNKETHYLRPEQLRIGVYVILEQSWISHPFPLNQFLIKDNEQLRALRAMKLKQYRYDPVRSTVPASELEGEAPSESEEPAAENKADAPAPDEPASEEKAPDPKLEKLEQHRKKIVQTEQAFLKAATVMQNLNRNLFSRSKETLEDMVQLVHLMIDAFIKSPEATLHVMGEKVGGEEAYHHNLNVCILCMMLAKELGFTPQTAHALGIAAMLHDIGKADIPDQILKKSRSDYNKAEWSLYRLHVEYGIDLVKKLGLSPAILQIISQHHEYCDGTGYPKGLTEAALSPAGRLVAMVNFYDNLCNPTDIQKAMTPHEALSYMFSKASAKFEKQALQIMIRNLGVYPPGSIVQLSTEAFAAVTSINPKKPLRPWVLVYEAGASKKEPLIIDLEAEPEISIVKSLSPAQLIPEVAAYLCPRKRLAYFFSGEDGKKGASGN